MSSPKRHHYLPESYLWRFANEKGFWVYDLKRDQYRPQVPRDTGVQSYFNAIENEKGERSFELEEMLSKIEGDVTGVMAKVEVRKELSDDERYLLAYFVALQRLRGPDFHDDTSRMSEHMLKRMMEMTWWNPEHARQEWERFQKDTGTAIDTTFEEMRAYVLKGDYKITTHRNMSLEMMLKLAPGFANLFYRLDWLFLCAPQAKTFVTADTPFSLFDSRRKEQRGPLDIGVGLGTPGATKLIPLSATTCLSMHDVGSSCSYVDATRELMRATNMQITYGATKFVIARDEELLRSLVAEIRNLQSERGFKWGGSGLTIA